MLVAISDIHGFDKKLVSLMHKLEFVLHSPTDTVIFLGDYVDGGPDTATVISKLMEAEKRYPHWQFLFGNHEDLMLDALIGQGAIYNSFNLWYTQGGKETLASYGASKYNGLDKIPAEHIQWLQNRPLTFETESFIFVHAGLRPNMTVETTPRQDKLWIREQFYDVDYNFGKMVIYGHTYSPTPRVRKHSIGIDTMHHGGGCLTAVLLNDRTGTVRKFIQSD